jgi:sugar lactone lactonase YvrE
MRRYLVAALLPLFTAAAGQGQDIPLSKILIEGEPWQVAAKSLPGITFLEGTPKGVVIYQGRPTARLRPDGKTQQLPSPRDGAERTYATASGGSVTYRLDVGSKSIIELAQRKQLLKVDGLAAPTCLTVWPDGAQLVIGDAGGKYLWTAPILRGGALGTPDRYYSLRVRPGEQASGVTAMTMDAGNLLYACTPLGVQVFDPTGRLCGVILPPSKEAMTALCIAGEKGDTLFVACGDKLYARKIQGKAVYTLKKDR